MPCKFRRKSSESNVASQAVHFNPQTSEVVLPEPCVEPKLSHRTTKSLYISHVVSIFYGTKIEVWVGFGPVGSTEKKIRSDYEQLFHVFIM